MGDIFLLFDISDLALRQIFSRLKPSLVDQALPDVRLYQQQAMVMVGAEEIDAIDAMRITCSTSVPIGW